MSLEIVAATGNREKLLELRNILSPIGVQVLSLADLDVDIGVEEDAETFEGNAVKKAEAVCAVIGMPTLADDSGLEVDGLDGRPGVHTARYGGPDLDDVGRYMLLLEELSGIPPEGRSARFQAAITYVEPESTPVSFLGTLEGSIARKPRGEHGFGFDPVFVPRGFDAPMAVLGPETKNRISHRARALAAFIRWYSARS
jgi:XTP/dITP diphosphohydrolase